MSNSNIELGQIVFGNADWFEVETPRSVTAGFDVIADAISDKRGDPEGRWGVLVSNSGCEAWETDVFAMRSYCWCDGFREGHEDGCPPNFEHYASGFSARWYKHSERGESCSRVLQRSEWTGILTECLADIEAAPDQTADGKPRARSER